MRQAATGVAAPPQPPRIDRVLAPFRDFSHTEASGGVLLFLATVAALFWANSRWGDNYEDLWQTTLTIEAGGYGLSMTLIHWINDGLMAIFFFVVGLEIKRELLVGELSSPRQASLPIVAAVGGAVAPALIYLALNAGSPAARGWGVPMATDIAFALGVLALLGSRAPTGLKIFLTALAIVDDIIAVLVIALFYTDDVAWDYLGLGALILLLLVAVNALHVSRPLVYAALGIALWVAFIQSGVHATVAGVLLAMTIPARTRIDSGQFLALSRDAVDAFERSGAVGRGVLTNQNHQSALQELETVVEHVESPMQRLEHGLHPWVAFLIVPLFALANAGVVFGADAADALASAGALGIIAGLLVGKQVGIMAGVWLLTRAGLSALPGDMTLRHVYGASWLAGIGFTMSLFIADLAFVDAAQLSTAKIGILAASIIAGGVGWLLLRAMSAQRDAESA